MILVTGGSGLVGSHLLFQLSKTQNEVLAIKRENSDLSVIKKIFNFYDIENGETLFEKIKWLDADVTDIFSLLKAFEGVEKVYHCAAVVSFNPSDIASMIEINVNGTANVVNACIEKGVKKLIHCSSIAAIGKPNTGNYIDESIIWKTSPRNSNYAISKFGAEREVWRGIEEGLNAAIVNPSVIIGPGDPSRSSGQLYRQIQKGLKFYTTGITGFVDVRDVSAAMILLMESDINSQRFILNSENLQYKLIFDMLAKEIGVKPPSIKAGKFLTQIAWRLEKVRSVFSGKKPLITKETVRNAANVSYYSNKKIIEKTGYSFIPINDAIKNTCRFYEKYLIEL
ncbi:MAG: NAD-dependent epimerase/dehydratase family protein [Bacteroidetes bacterium]|nr:NAD-dependent epimerase/dehydratase family protein [Bacteroidota bacterium]